MEDSRGDSDKDVYSEGRNIFNATYYLRLERKAKINIKRIRIFRNVLELVVGDRFLKHPLTIIF